VDRDFGFPPPNTRWIPVTIETDDESVSLDIEIEVQRSENRVTDVRLPSE